MYSVIVGSLSSTCVIGIMRWRCLNW